MSLEDGAGEAGGGRGGGIACDGGAVLLAGAGAPNSPDKSNTGTLEAGTGAGACEPSRPVGDAS
jgi:hypothetical protein